jgi:cell division septal protein FtsQ
VREKKRRGNSRYYLFFLLSLMAVVAIATGLVYTLRHLSIFDLDQITINGNLAIPDSLIQKASNSYLGTNLFSISKRDLRQDLQKISRLKDVKIRKHLLNKMSLEISESEGLLYVKSFEGNLYPVDADGVVLSRYSKVYREDLPIYSSYYKDAQFKPGIQLTKPDLKRILALHQRMVKEAPEYLHIISEYYMIDNTINIIDARYGTRIIPSEDNMATQLKRYQFVQDNGNISRKSVVDLRFENQVVVKAGDK